MKLFSWSIVQKEYNKVLWQEMLWMTFQELVILEIHYAIFQVSFMGPMKFSLSPSYLTAKRDLITIEISRIFLFADVYEKVW